MNVEAFVKIIRDNKITLAGVAASLFVWWTFVGRKKYLPGKGTTRYV